MSEQGHGEDKRSARAAEQPDGERPSGEAADAPQGGEAQSGPAQDAAELQRQLEAEREESARLRDQAMRAAAEMENVRRRTQRDVEHAHKFALEKFATDLLPVADSLEKAVESVHAHPGGDESTAAIGEGVELSLRLFLDTLAKQGIEQIDPAGERFNPDYHEAMSMVASEEAAPNTVVHVMQKGYLLNGRVLRPALVTVAKQEGAGRPDSAAAGGGEQRSADANAGADPAAGGDGGSEG